MLAVLIVIGSCNLAHFDAALVGDTFAVLFATFGLTYRYAMWLRRPPTGVYWRRGWQAFFRSGRVARNVAVGAQRVGSEVLASRFIVEWSRLRAITHLLIMWGCLLAVAITFPLVFGWLHFRPVAGDLSLYEAVVFGFPAFRFPHASVVGFFLFHGLVWSSFLVIAGVMLAATAHARGGRSRRAALRRGLHAARAALPRQRDGPDADGQLHVDGGLRLHVHRHPARHHGHPEPR